MTKIEKISNEIVDRILTKRTGKISTWTFMKSLLGEFNLTEDETDDCYELIGPKISTRLSSAILNCYNENNIPLDRAIELTLSKYGMYTKYGHEEYRELILTTITLDRCRKDEMSLDEAIKFTLSEYDMYSTDLHKYYFEILEKRLSAMSQ